MNQRFAPLYILPLLISLLIIVASCGGSDQTSTETHFVRSMNIQDAATLMIAEDEGKTRLYKILPDGTIDLVKFFDEDGKEVEVDTEASAIYRINEELQVTVFGDDEDAATLLSRKDGSVVTIGIGEEFVPVLQSETFLNESTFMTDAAGHVYYLAGESPFAQVVRIDIADFATANDLTDVTLTREILTPESENVLRFAVGDNGALAYEGEIVGSRRAVRLRHNDQSLQTFASRVLEGELPQAEFWRGVSDLFIEYEDENDFGDSDIDDTFRVVGNGIGRYTLSPYADLRSEHSFGSTLGVFRLALKNHLFFARKEFFDDDEIHNGFDILEVEGTNSGPRTIDSDLTRIVLATASDSAYYLVGVDDTAATVLVRGVPGQDSVTPIVLDANEQFEFTHIEASSDDEVTFNAIRLSDSAEVIGKIDSSQKVTFTEEKPFDGQVHTLVPLL